MSDGEVAEGATMLLQKTHKNIDLLSPRYIPTLVIFISKSKSNIIICFSQVTRNRWTCDPFTLGAYSYPTTRAKEGDQVMQRR